MPSPPQQLQHIESFREHHVQQAFSAPTRKQNTACDGCRARKVKCVHPIGQPKCDHCTLKRMSCTYALFCVSGYSRLANYITFRHVIQAATQERKRQKAAQHTKSRATAASPPPGQRTPHHSPSRRTSFNASTIAIGSPAPTHQSLDSGSSGMIDPAGSRQSSPSSGGTTSTAQLIAWLLAPDGEASTPPSQISYSWRGGQGRPGSSSEHATAELSPVDQLLVDDYMRNEFALDLTETYFQIVHIRIPLLNPDLFRARLRASISTTSLPIPSGYTTAADTLGPPAPAMLAALMACGAKFSDHHLMQLDRETNGGKSRIQARLLDRAMEIAEAEKVYRTATLENITLAMILEGMDPLTLGLPERPYGPSGFWLKVAVDHLFALGYNKDSVVSGISDVETKGRAYFAWWITYLTDAYSSAFFRRKPALSDYDHSHAPPVAIDTTQYSDHSEFAIWLSAVYDLAVAARKLSVTALSARAQTGGIVAAELREVATLLYRWRDNHLVRVGVPTTLQVDWDYLKAITCCVSDANYHVMWIIANHAILDFGIHEPAVSSAQPDIPVADGDATQSIEDLKREIAYEALHAATRISALTSLLTTHGYLRLDYNVLHYAIYAAGLTLAREGAPEAMTCISGLRQYSSAYPDAGPEADYLASLFAQTTIGQQRSADPHQAELDFVSSNSNSISPISPTVPGQHTTIDLNDNIIGFGTTQDVTRGGHSLLGISHDLHSTPQPNSQHPSSYLTYAPNVALLQRPQLHNGLAESMMNLGLSVDPSAQPHNHNNQDHATTTGQAGQLQDELMQAELPEDLPNDAFDHLLFEES
ncbi:hypothetical protein CALCODRAFT_465982 [Calocera cornea HHB12733]|uniref:Zn(2)-C6 fungal-type domain-containing protein n=1 Tax=Calocera cornea HHB12733 TaxID=1353952 RepID=A0A165I3K7_9BASI|nr:hypothetical protein CALCODRAFT_465982 [Calocera cornea HHB12733]